MSHSDWGQLSYDSAAADDALHSHSLVGSVDAAAGDVDPDLDSPLSVDAPPGTAGPCGKHRAADAGRRADPRVDSGAADAITAHPTI